MGPNTVLAPFTLDAWLRDHALRSDAAGIARTVVWTGSDDLTVVGYHAVAPTQVTRVDIPGRSLTAGYTTIPGYLIARLALDGSVHKQGLGTELLYDALRRIVAAADRAGGRLILVDAIDEQARAFYRHHDFQEIVGSARLVIKVSAAVAAIAAG